MDLTRELRCLFGKASKWNTILRPKWKEDDSSTRKFSSIITTTGILCIKLLKLNQKKFQLIHVSKP
ncbi:hypothetical protein V2J09_020520 [Rumex salicifolius]